MQVRDHVAQHDAAEDLPLVTESAVVTGLESMDENRTTESIAAIDAILETYGTDQYESVAPSTPPDRRQFLRDRLDDTDPADDDRVLEEYLRGTARNDAPGSALAKLEARYRRPYPSLVELTVETDDPVDFQPGQYLSIRLESVTRPYSIASPQRHDALSFCIRRVPGGELTPGLVDSVEQGTELSLRGPYGDLLLQDVSERDVVFLATGTGVAPFRPMIDYLFESGRTVVNGTERDIWLFLGAGWEDDLPYDAYFSSLADEHDRFHYIPTLSREPLLTDWEGETDYVQYVLTKHLDSASVDTDLDNAFAAHLDADPVDDVQTTLDPHDMDVYACGVSAMVSGLVDAVKQLGVPESRTEFEAFG